MKKHPVDISEMLRLYVDERMTLLEVAKRFGVSKQAIHDRLRRLGVETRPNGLPRVDIDRETLHRLYVEERLTQEQVSQRLGVRVSDVKREMKRHGIAGRVERRRREGIDRELLARLYVDEWLSLNHIAKKLHIGAEVIKRELRGLGIEIRPRRLTRPRFDRDLLVRLYQIEGKSAQAVAQILGTTRCTVTHALKRHAIPVRPPGAQPKRPKDVAS